MNRAKINIFDGCLHAPVEPVTPVVYEPRIERHPIGEAFIMLSGECRYLLNGEEIRLRAGDCCLILPWIPHLRGFLEEDHPCEQLWFHPDQVFFVRIRSVGGGDYAVLDRGNVPQEYLLLYQHLAGDYQASGDPDPLKAFFTLLLLETEKGHHAVPDKKMDLTESVKAYIRNRNGANCSMAELEKYTGYSRSHIAHLFRETCGVSVGEYIQGVRCEYTVNALAFGMKQKEIASALGFSSPSAFWQWYRKFR